MRHVIKFVWKDWLKSKYIWMVPLIVFLMAGSYYAINTSQTESTQRELVDTFDGRLTTVGDLISKWQLKEQMIGVTPIEKEGIASLLIQEQYLKEIVLQLETGDLDIAERQQVYLEEYHAYTELVPLPYLTLDTSKESSKANLLVEHNLAYTEEKTPTNTALYTKQLFELIFNPITLFLFLMVFTYRYLYDRESRAFDFFKLQSLSNRAMYLGYLLPMLSIMGIYILLGVIVAFAPMILTGNLQTLHYPLEIIASGESLFVPVWKWLVFIPVGWMLLLTMLLLVMIVLIKQRVTIGALFAVLSVPLILLYIVALNSGFSLVNPIHLLVLYENPLLTSSRWMTYMALMFMMTLMLFGLVYLFIRAKNTSWLRMPSLSFAFKPFTFMGRFRLVQFEYLKKKRKGHIALTFLLLFAIMGGTLATVHQQYQSLPEKGLRILEMQQQFVHASRTNMQMNQIQYEAEIEMRKKMDEQAGLEDVEYEEDVYVEIIDTLDEQYEELEALKKQVYSPEFPRLYHEYSKALYGESYKQMDPTTWSVTAMASEEQRHLLEERDILPWPLGNLWVSHYDGPRYAETPEFREINLNIQEYNTKYDTSSLFTAYRWMEWNIPLAVYFLLIVVLWTAISDERRPQSTLHFLVTKTIPVKSAYMAKWLFNLASAYSLLFICGGIVFLIATLIGGLGHPDYPMLVYSPERTGGQDFQSVVDNGYFYFEDLSTLLLSGLVLLLAQVFFLSSLFTFIGKWMNNHAATIVLTLIVSIAGYIVGDRYVELTGPFNPFLYLNTWNVVDGWLSVLTDTVWVNVWTGSLILLLAGSLFVFAGRFVKRKVTA